MDFENLPAVQEKIDIFNLLDQQFDQSMSALDESYNFEIGRLDKPVNYQKRSLQKQYDIKADYLGKQYLSDEDYIDSLQKLNQQLELGAAKIDGKIAPQKEELLASYKQNQLRLKQDYNQRKIRVQQIQELVNFGHITAEVGTQQQLKVLGINVPTTQFKPPTPIEQYKELQSLENQLRTEVARYWIAPTTGGWLGRAKPLRYSPTGEITATTLPENLREATEEEKVQYENLLSQYAAVRAAKLDILGQYEPRRAALQRRARRFTDVAIRQTTSFKNEIEKSKQEFLNKTGRSKWNISQIRGFNFAAGVYPGETKSQPTPAELRKQNTKEAYNKGVKLGYWK